MDTKVTNLNNNNNNSNQDDTEMDFRGGKRSRATREQLAILEEAFRNNSQPTAKAREQLAKRLNMPDRTVQIWFQNRRAKIKLGQRKHHMALKEEALRQHCLAAYSGKAPMLPPQFARPGFAPGVTPGMTPDANQISMFPSHASPAINHANQFSPFPQSSPFFNNPNQFHSFPNSTFSTPVVPPAPKFDEGISSKCAIFPASILTIGTWRRMPIGDDDLVCSFSVETSQMAWVIGDKHTKFRICFPFSAITAIRLSFIDSIYAELKVTINAPPSFSTLTPDKIWSPCGDFTENHQATSVRDHIVTGDALSLRVQLMKLLEVSNRLVTLTEIMPTPSLQDPTNDPQFKAEKKLQMERKMLEIGMKAKETQEQTHSNNNTTRNPHQANYAANLGLGLVSNLEKSSNPNGHPLSHPMPTTGNLPFTHALNPNSVQNTPNPNPSLPFFPNYVNYDDFSNHATPILNQNPQGCFSPSATPVFDMNGFNYGDYNAMTNSFNNLNQFGMDLNHQQQDSIGSTTAAGTNSNPTHDTLATEDTLSNLLLQAQAQAHAQAQLLSSNNNEQNTTSNGNPPTIDTKNE